MSTTTTPTRPDRVAQPTAPLGRSGVGRAWWTVARREMLVKLTDKAFLIGTVVMVALIAGFLGLSAFMGERTQTYAVAAVPADAAQVRSIGEAITTADAKVKVTIDQVGDAAAAKAALEAGTADAWLHQGDDGWTLTAKNEVPEGLAAAAGTVVRRDVVSANAVAAGTSAAALEAGSVLQTGILHGDAAQQTFGKVLGFVMAFLFYMASIGFGMTLAMSVVEEKASRIIEIITTKIPVRQLLAGKVLGNSVMALGQMALFTGMGLIGLSFTDYGAFVPAISGAVVWFIAFFVVGFLLIACLWAVAGALASRTEDVQSTSMPLTMGLMIVWFSAFLAKGTVLTVLSFIPPFSPVLMPMRLAQGQAAWWEPIIAIILLCAAAAVVVVGAERLYRRSLLQTQGRLSVRQAWSLGD